MTHELWRNGINQLQPYVPGKAIEDVKNELAIEEVIRLASNENPFGPSPKAVLAMQETSIKGNLYPESSCRELRKKLGEKFSVYCDQIVVSNGADNIITLIGQAYINPGDEILYCTPTFPAYRTISLLMGGVPIEVPTNDNFQFDLSSILTRISSKTKLIFVCNPNNPTGTIVDTYSLKQFLLRIPEHAIVVLDEAYIEFVDINGYRAGIDWIKAGYRIITIRTFSKLYGLAGLRVGYAIAPKTLIDPIVLVKEPFSVNRIAHDAALAAIDDVEYVEQSLRLTKEGKEYLSSQLEQLGFEVISSHANFLFVNLHQNTTQIFYLLMKKGLLIRPCHSWGLENYARITIGTREQNDRLIRELIYIQKNANTEKVLEGEK